VLEFAVRATPQRHKKLSSRRRIGQGPSVLAGYEGEHFICPTTFGGALHLVYSSFTPIPGLLEAIKQKIASACTDA
jgi:hypothetical protein